MIRANDSRFAPKKELIHLGWFLGALTCLTLGTHAFGAEPADAPMPVFSKGFKFIQQDGKSLYQAICQGCHMPAGQGVKGAGMYPALANNPKVASAAYVINNVLNGRGGMPALGNFLSDEQVGAVTTYVRTNMGNNFVEPVTAKEAAGLRLP